jgi:uncharacterized RDD family membrane protein YckC
MKSLEEITIQRTSSHIQTGTNGIDRKVTQTYNHKLKVKTIEGGLRFVHLIVDYFILVILTYLIAAIPAINNTFLSLLNLITFLIYPLFYAIMEFKFQQTPGKMITNYVVIDKFANNPDFKTCLLRTLIRFVPLEPFSCLGSPSRGWHDKWTDTYVVHKNEVAKLKSILEKENNNTTHINPKVTM